MKLKNYFSKLKIMPAPHLFALPFTIDDTIRFRYSFHIRQYTTSSLYCCITCMFQLFILLTQNMFFN